MSSDPHDPAEAEPPPREGVPATRLMSTMVLLMGTALFLGLPFVLSVGAVVFLPLVTGIILTIILTPLADRRLIAVRPLVQDAK